MPDYVSLLAETDLGSEAQESHHARMLAFREIIRQSFGKTDDQVEMAAHFCAIVVELALVHRRWPFSPDQWHGHPPSMSMLRDTARAMPGVGQSSDRQQAAIRATMFRSQLNGVMSGGDVALSDTQQWALKKMRGADPADRIAAMQAIISSLPDPRPAF